MAINPTERSPELSNRVEPESRSTKMTAEERQQAAQKARERLMGVFGVQSELPLPPRKRHFPSASDYDHIRNAQIAE